MHRHAHPLSCHNEGKQHPPWDVTSPGPGTDATARRVEVESGLLLRAVAGRERGWTAALVAGTVLTTGAGLAVPGLLAAAVDAAVHGRTDTATKWLACVLVLSAVGETASALAGATVRARVTVWLRARVLGSVLAGGVPGTVGRSVGDLAGRLTTGTALMAGLPASVLSVSLGLATSIGAVVALAVIDWRLAVAWCLMAPVAILTARAFLRGSTDAFQRYQEAQGRLAGRLLNTLAGIRTVRASGNWRQEVGRITAVVPELSRHGHAAWTIQRAMMWRMGLVAPAVEIAVLAVAGHGVLTGRDTPGDLVAAVGYTALALSGLDYIDTLGSIAQARSGARRVAEVSADPPKPFGNRQLTSPPGLLEFRAVLAPAEGPPVLRGVDLVVPAGQVVAVVGRSGAGKSLLGELAAGLRRPTSGQVLLDGVPLDELDPAARRKIVYVFERPTLLGDTVADAIGYGAPGAEQSVIEQAARTACAHDFVRRLPSGYRTSLVDAPMSGGEVQRLGLARALVTEPGVVILDDATSSLDSVTEAQVSAAVTDRLAGGIRLVIAHRASTAARCDLVAWLHDGRIVATASHADLWAEHPAYRQLFAHRTEEVAS